MTTKLFIPTILIGLFLLVSVVSAADPWDGYVPDSITGVEPVTVYFTDISYNSPTSWSWEYQWIWKPCHMDSCAPITDAWYVFNTTQNPVDVFYEGNKSIRLNSSNAYGFNITPSLVYINVTGTGAHAPVADFVAVPVSGLTPLSVSFIDASTNLPTNWDWYWYANETKSSDDQNPTTTLTTGTYNVRLWVNNSAGDDWVNKTAYVTVTTDIIAPIAGFTSDVTSGVSPLTVHFTDNSTNYPTSWLWTFDGINTSLAQDPLHIYEAAGVYTVSLQAQNTAGSDVETKTNYITVTGLTPTPTPVPTTPEVTPIIPISSTDPRITGWSNITSSGITLTIEGITGSDVWLVYGQNSGGYTWMTANSTAASGNATVVITSSPMFGNTLYYIKACDSVACGAEISFRTSAITPVPTTTFGSGYKDITGMR